MPEIFGNLFAYNRDYYTYVENKNKPMEDRPSVSK